VPPSEAPREIVGSAEDLFASPSRYVTIPRVDGLLSSSAGDRLVAIVSHLTDDRARYSTYLWELGLDGEVAPRRLTASAGGELGATFLADGSLLFLARVEDLPSSVRDRSKHLDPNEVAVWQLSPDEELARPFLRRPGKVLGVVGARHANSVVVVATCAPNGADDDADQAWWTTRRRLGVTARWFDGLPVRLWDHFVGPEETHLYSTVIDPASPGWHGEVRDLTSDAGQALYDAHPVIVPDGTLVISEWAERSSPGQIRSSLVSIDLTCGLRQVIVGAADDGFDYVHPAVSPDGHRVVALRRSRSTPEAPGRVDLWLGDLRTGEGRTLGLGDEPFVVSATFNHDGTTLIVTAEWHGRMPLYEIALDTGKFRRLTDEGSWTSVALPTSPVLYALRSALDSPPRPVALELEDGCPWQAQSAAGTSAPASEAATRGLVLLHAPGEITHLPGRVDEVITRSSGGDTIRAWLVVPDRATPDLPAPLAVWIHGGPMMSWSAWLWRTNPWVLAAQGWAVLLPDPALSTGYGQAMIQRGWGQWGGAPFDDLMRLTDAALDRHDLDRSRTAAIGGSFGGYMANWIAGHTDRFRAIVTHASIWSLEQFQATTDRPWYWADEFGLLHTNSTFYEQWSPNRFVDRISTPMLITHGERDFRCPISESLRMWTDLVSRSVDARLLTFDDENHWILGPGNTIAWYETVLAFLREKVLDEAWERPEMV
jgi:dipeptidyl aminopeptidase/acylaminoacyl peptidase